MIILDTNVISELMRPVPHLRVQHWLLSQHDTPLSTTAITIAEIEFGLRRLPEGRRRDELSARFESFANSLAVLPLDDLAAREAGRLRALREGAVLPSHPSDMLIAGIAAVTDAALATRNIKDFWGLPLRLADPWEERPGG